MRVLTDSVSPHYLENNSVENKNIMWLWLRLTRPVDWAMSHHPNLYGYKVIRDEEIQHSVSPHYLENYSVENKNRMWLWLRLTRPVDWDMCHQPNLYGYEDRKQVTLGVNITDFLLELERDFFLISCLTSVDFTDFSID